VGNIAGHYLYQQVLLFLSQVFARPTAAKRCGVERLSLPSRLAGRQAGVSQLWGNKVAAPPDAPY